MGKPEKAETTEVEVEKAPEKHLHILPSAHHDESQRVRRHVVFALDGYELKDYLNPKAWASIADKIEPHNIVTVIAEDGSWFAMLFVVSAARNWLDLEVLIYKEFGKSTDAPEENDEYIVKWKGPSRKHCVVRVDDGSVVIDQISSKEDAIKAKNDYMKALRM